MPISLAFSSTSPVENSWTTKTRMPTARQSSGVGVVNKRIYAIGGFPITDVNEEYDPLTDTWVTRKPMPTARMGFAITVYQNKIYVIGGETDWSSSKGCYIQTNVNEVYDPATDSWETKAPMPAPRSQMTASTVDDKMYVIGGIVDPLNGKITHVNEVYDPQTDTWSIGNSMPTSRVSLAIAVVDDLLYALGGTYPAGNYGQTSFDAQKREFTLLSNYDSEPLNFVPQENCRLNEQYVPFGYGTLQPIVTITSPMSEVYNASTVPLLFFSG